MTSEREVVRPAASMALSTAFMVLAVAFTPLTTLAVRVHELSAGGCSGARACEFAMMLGERGDLPIVQGQRGVLPALQGERGMEDVGDGERGVLPVLLGERSLDDDDSERVVPLVLLGERSLDDDDSERVVPLVPLGERGLEDGERGVLPMLLGERGLEDVDNGERSVPPVLLGERGVEDVGDGEPGVLPVLGERGLEDVRDGVKGGRDVLPMQLGNHVGTDGLEDVGDGVEGDPGIVFMDEEGWSEPNEEGMEEHDDNGLPGMVVQEGHGAAPIGALEDGAGVQERVGESVGIEHAVALDERCVVLEELQPMFNLVDVPMPSMKWVEELQATFDQLIDGMGDQVVVGNEEDNVMLDGGVNIVGGGEEIVGGEEIDEIVGEGEDIVGEEVDEQVHNFDFLTAGEQVIWDIMFQIHHPNIVCNDNGTFSRED